MKNERNQEIDMTWKYAFKQSLPIMAGYVVLGMGFGVLLETKGYGVGWAFLMSCFIYAGSLLGAVLNFNSTGIDFSMTALFLVVFVEQWCSTKNHISAVEFSAFCDFWRRQENTGLYHLFIFCFALCHYGNVSYLLSEKCESGYSTTWTA